MFMCVWQAGRTSGPRSSFVTTSAGTLPPPLRMEVKRGLATLAPDTDAYADARDPACDLIYRAAEAWATEAGWEPSDSPD